MLAIWERAVVLWCCIKIGTRPDEGCLLTKDGHNRQLVTLCQESYCGGVHRSTLTKRLPQRLCCSLSAEPGDPGERSHWNNRSSMTAMQGADDLSGLLPSAFRLFTGTYLAQNPMTGKCCEASNIFVPYLALSKVQHHVGIDVLLGAWIKLPLYLMISAIFEYWLSTPASGMPFCTWCQTILPLLLISGISEYLPSQTILPEALKPATNEKPKQHVKTELFPLMKKGFSSVVDLIITFENMPLNPSYTTSPVI